MRKNALFLMVVAGVLVVPMALFVGFGHMKHAREQELARLTGDDEQTRLIRQELEEYRDLNANQQVGAAAVGGVIVVVAGIWWVISQFRGHNT